MSSSSPASPSSKASPASIDAILKSRFQLSRFRKGQREIIESVLEKRDALAVMPTGGGKSLCYQLPALMGEGLVIVISPLIALMEDQVRNLNRLGIAAGFVHSNQSFEDKRKLFAKIAQEKQFILYLSPERVQKGGFADWIKRQKILLFAVDESHCVSQWGPDFRKDYYRLGLLRELRTDVPILALTATATPEVLGDIVKQLQLRSPDQHIHGFYRPNLYYQVEWCEDDSEKEALLRQALRQTPKGRVIVYCGTRSRSEDLVHALQDEFSSLNYYHAGRTPEDRVLVQKEFETGKTRILFATNAFGMGIDHPDVRLVVHYQMPASIESFYQEMGRAGRDGEDSNCLLLYSKKDKGLHSHFIRQSDADRATINRRWDALSAITLFSEGGECRHAGILTYFKDSFRMKACGHCDICGPLSPRRILRKASVTTSHKAKAKPNRKRGTPSVNESMTKAQELRYEILREWRKSYAESHDIPAFLVFSNKTLIDLVKKNPRTLSELEQVYGFGPHKVEHLGKLVLDHL